MSDDTFSFQNGKFSFNVGRQIDLNGSSYPLIGEVSTKTLDSGKITINIIVSLPEDYPKTAFYLKIKETDDENLFILNISCAGKKDDIYLEYGMSSINIQENYISSLPEEKKAFKGLGKIVLCVFFSEYLQKVIPFINKDSVISLLADPQVDRCEHLLEEYSKQSVTSLLKHIKNSFESLNLVFTNTFYDYKMPMNVRFNSDEGNKLLFKLLKESENFIDKEFLVEKACNYVQLNSLVSYYESFTFKRPSNLNLRGVKMQTTFGDLLNACSNPKPLVQKRKKSSSESKSKSSSESKSKSSSE